MSTWKHIPLDRALATGPAGSGGVYLVVRVDRPWRSHSAPLNSTLLMRDLSGIELWLRELAPREARRAEKTLIHWLRPTLNKIKYEGEDHG